MALEALWTDSQLNPQQIAYNEAIAISKRGPIDLPALREAFNALVSRHEIWHSVIQRVDGVPVLLTRPPARHVLTVVDLSALGTEAAERQAVRIIAEMARVPYDVAHGPLVRPKLLAMPGDEHRLYLGLHHMTFDGVSLFRTIVPELIALYDASHEGRPVPLEPLPARYGDYARWEQEWITSPRARRRLAHWRQRLDPPPPAPSLPLDQPRRELPRHRGGTLGVELSPATTAALYGVARSAGASAFQVFGAIWAALLNHFSGETDIIFGAPADLRQRSELESVVGYCLTPVILRVDLSDDPTILELVARVRNELLDGLDHLVPFERILRDDIVAPNGGGNPVYQTLLTLEPTMSFADPTWSMRLMDSALGDAIGSAKLDLELQLDEGADGRMAGRLIYDRDLFSAETGERLVAAWHAVAVAVAADPERRVSELELRTPADHARQAEFTATATERHASTVMQRFAALAAEHPLHPALSAAGASVSYAELGQAVSDAAARLRAAGLSPGDGVAVCLPPTIELVTAALAALSLGGLPLLLNPTDPADALSGRAATAGCAIAVIAGTGVAGSALAGLTTLTLCPTPSEAHGPSPAAAVGFGPDAPASLHACIGRPGHVAALSHDAVNTIADTFAEQIGVTAADTVMALPVMLYASPSTELWPALAAGARLVLAPPEVEADGEALRSLIRSEGVTFLHATPSRWATLIDSGIGSLRGLRVLSGSDNLSRKLADQLLERFRVVWNAYAPAVVGGYVALGRVMADGPVTIGRPVDNHRAHVVNPQGRPQPAGFVGALLIAGAVAQAGDPSEEQLCTEPGTGSTALHTGVCARWLSDGRLALVEPRDAGT